MNKRLLLTIVLAGCCHLAAPAQQIAVKTNLLYWATGTLNLGAEVAVSKHSTISLTANCNPWTFGSDNKIQAWFVQPEYRYWFTEKFTRHYVGVHLIGGKFEIGGFKLPFGLFKNLRNHYYKGSVVGAGISYGYHFYISPRWNLEAMVGVGLARINYHAEPVSGPKAASYRNTTRYLPVPTEVGISFVYLFNSKK